MTNPTPATPCKVCGKPQKLIGPRCECGETEATPGGVRAAAERIAGYLETGMHPSTQEGKRSIIEIIEDETLFTKTRAAVEKALAALSVAAFRFRSSTVEWEDAAEDCDQAVSALRTLHDQMK